MWERTQMTNNNAIGPDTPSSGGRIEAWNTISRLAAARHIALRERKYDEKDFWTSCCGLSIDTLWSQYCERCEKEFNDAQ